MKAEFEGGVSEWGGVVVTRQQWKVSQLHGRAVRQPVCHNRDHSTVPLSRFLPLLSTSNTLDRPTPVTCNTLFHFKDWAAWKTLS